MVKQYVLICVRYLQKEPFEPWTLSIQPKVPKISKQGQMTWIFRWKFPENPEIVEFPIKSEPFNQNSRNSRRKIKQKGNSQLRNFWKFGYTSQGCPLFQKFQIPLEIKTGIFHWMESNPYLYSFYCSPKLLLVLIQVYINKRSVF